MGWDGATLWMLPRAARAIETGCSVFTMNLVRGHYLSDRRASTLVRVMKYADKGYGIRFLPSYISSLAGRTRTSRNPVLDGRPLDLSSIAAEQRQRTSDTVQDALNRADSFYTTNAFDVWEMERRGEVSLTTINWASNSYEDEVYINWDPHFDIAEFQQQIVYSNKAEIANWIETDLHDRLFPQGIVNPEDLDDRFQRITCAPSVDEVLSRKKDVMLQVLLPCDFAVYANDLVSQAQAHAGLRETKLLMPMVRQFNFLGAPNPQTDGLFLWRVGKELMWQQLDRRIDEVFEVLYAFRRVNKHLRADPALQAPRLSKELARGGVDSEFDAFALWVGSN
ncbi:hypothetical protein FB451DRAFT_1232352 [Mycena latifolia]|nr:hypothetical protein FB451DRAFT_1232352 [Mycena latifolia]